MNTDASQLVALEEAWTEAILRNDAGEIGRFMTEDWILIGPDGKLIPRTAFLGVIKSGELTHETMQLSDWRVCVYGEAAAVTTCAESSGRYQGEPFRTRERSTSVYARIGGQWRCVLTQLSPLNP